METRALLDFLGETLKEYSESKEKIKHCLLALEINCRRLIEQIRISNRDSAEGKFDELHRIQAVLSRAVFVQDVDIGDALMSVVRDFERLDEPESRDYWFKRMHDGYVLPSS
ncbi:hypothetical protein [Ochrobactrum sp. MYb379]|uniref:hypothetical protein n=1 Tax=Ochrobactrum sp. MYb379 TaxID=2745275 RepID=UPI00309EE077